jgi:hypothetical protein
MCGMLNVEKNYEGLRQEDVYWADGETEEEEFLDHRIATKGIKILREYNSKVGGADKEAPPFFLAVGFHQPHEPFHFPERMLKFYNNTDMKSTHSASSSASNNNKSSSSSLSSPYFPVTKGVAPKFMPTTNVGDRKPQRGSAGSKMLQATAEGGRVRFGDTNKYADTPESYSSSQLYFLTNQVEFDRISKEGTKLPLELERGDNGLYSRFPASIRAAGVLGYSCSIAFMDEQVGRIVDALKEMNMYDETVILFSSDHGLNVVEYGGWGKRMLLDSNARVPLIVKAAKSDGDAWKERGAVVDSVVESLDIFPTIVELAGDKKMLEAIQSEYPPLQGSSLLPDMLTGNMTSENSQQHQRFAISQSAKCSQEVHDPISSPLALDGPWREWTNCGLSVAGSWMDGKYTDPNTKESWSWKGRKNMLLLATQFEFLIGDIQCGYHLITLY